MGSGLPTFEGINGSSFVTNNKGDKWKFKMKKNSSPQIYNVNIELEGDLSNADPELNPGTPIDDLVNIHMQVTLDDEVFFLNTTREREK